MKKDKNKKQAVIYCRVSTKDQVENNSLEIQEKACRDYCRRTGLEVDEIFIDKGESAKTTERPQFKEMIKYCDKNKKRIGWVVVYAFDRFSRDTLSHLVERLNLNKLGIELRSATQPIDDSPAGKFSEHIFAASAQFDNDVRAERAKDGMQAAREKGKWVNKPPIGYRKTLKGILASLEPDPVMGSLIREAFEIFSTGRYSVEEVRRKINALGLRTYRGNPISAQTFIQVIKNPIYKGRVVSRINGTDDPGDFEPLVPEELFDRTQAILKQHMRSPMVRQINNPGFPLRGFILCGKCGVPLTGSISRGRSKKYPYYWCRTKKCKNNTRKEKMELMFMKYVGSLRPTIKHMRLFREIIINRWEEIQSENIRHKKMIGQEINELEIKKQRLIDAFIHERSITKEIYEDQLKKIEEKSDSLKIESTLLDSNMELDIEGVMRFAEKILLRADSLWNELPPERKVKLQKVLFPGGIAFDGSAFRTAESNSIFSYLNPENIEGKNLAVPTGIEPVLPA